MSKKKKSISVTGTFYDKLKATAKERDTSIAAIVEAAIVKDLGWTSCWCGATIDPGNDCCRAGHRVYDDDGEPLSTQTGVQGRRR